MRLLDLFSGIGGFSLAATWAGIEPVQFVEYDAFCRKVLKRRFKGVPIHDDIKTFKGQRGSADIISGGFPCQPFSLAGRRRGSEDDRALWPEMLRVISEVQPAWVLGENVAGIVGVELDKVLFDLENAGYDSQAFIIPACATGAEHRRDRVWIVSNFVGDGKERRCTNTGKGCFERKIVETKRCPRVYPGAFASGAVYGVSRGMDVGKRIKALGNAIVPQVAFRILKSIKEVETCSIKSQ